MNNQQRGIIDLIRAALSKTPICLPDDFDWELACNMGGAHHILPLLYYGAHNAGLSLPKEVGQKLEATIFQGVFRDQNQLYELERLRACFVEHGIEFMPLKGSLLKKMYPQTDMRPMSDADVLIKMEQYEAIVPLMEALGYTAVLESDHELTWNKPGALYLELHKRLIPSYNKDYYAYFGDGWRLAHPTATTEYVMGDEDQFVYLFTHYAKHYRDAGIGIRHLVDLYIYLQNKPDLDWEYVERELEKLQLLTFCRYSLATIDVWFKGAEGTPRTDFITDRIFGSGAFGVMENHLLSEGLKISKQGNKKQVQRKKRMQYMFPSAQALTKRYPCLEKCPWLLPLVWVHRSVTAVLFRRDNIRTQQAMVDVMTADNISDYQDELNYVGLDFNFEE